MGEAGRGSANGRGRQRFSQWEGSAEVQPMGEVGRGSANGTGRQRFSQWEGSAEVQPMGGVCRRQGQELRERQLLSWGFHDSSVGKESTCDAGGPGSIPGSG